MLKHSNSMRMQQTSRSQQVPLSSVTAYLVPDGQYGSLHTTDLPAIGYTKSFEAKVENSEGSHTEWKTWQHYKSVVGSPLHMQIPEIYVYGANEENYPRYRVVVDGGTTAACWGVENEYGDLGRPVNGLPLFYDPQPDGFVPSPAGLDGMLASALRSMLPLIKSELSLVNSVIELKDFKSLGQSLKGIQNLVYPTRNRRRRRRTLQQLCQTGADCYLQVKFNILPLLSDIRGIQTALSRYERRINDLVTRAGRVQRKHYCFRWTEYADKHEIGPDGYFVVTESGYDPAGRLQARRETVYEPSKFHAEIEYNYNYTQYQLEHAQVLALLDALGINLNPQIIWNAIPWSFVVDWVVDVSRWLGQFAKPWMAPTINIRRFLWSVARERRIYTYRRVCNRFNQTYNGTWAPLPVVVETSYRRQTGLPGMSSITSSGLSSEEVSLGAALVVSRRRRPNTSRRQ